VVRVIDHKPAGSPGGFYVKYLPLLLFSQNFPTFGMLSKLPKMATTSTIASLEAEITRLQHLVDQCTDACKLLSGTDPQGFSISFAVTNLKLSQYHDASHMHQVATFTGGPAEGDLMMSFFMYWGGFYNRQLQHTKRILQHQKAEMPH